MLAKNTSSATGHEPECASDMTPLMIVSSSSLKNVWVRMTGNTLAGMYNSAAVITKEAVVARLCGRRTCTGEWQRGQRCPAAAAARIVARQRVQTRRPRLRPVIAARTRGELIAVPG